MYTVSLDEIHADLSFLCGNKHKEHSEDLLSCFHTSFRQALLLHYPTCLPLPGLCLGLLFAPSPPSTLPRAAPEVFFCHGTSLLLALVAAKQSVKSSSGCGLVALSLCPSSVYRSKSSNSARMSEVEWARCRWWSWFPLFPLMPLFPLTPLFPLIPLLLMFPLLPLKPLLPLLLVPSGNLKASLFEKTNFREWMMLSGISFSCRILFGCGALKSWFL